ncbi:long-chain fatty acid--CoA ligase [Nonomuraea sp. NPDC050663]|uniref:long-chain fatty acid--CoA ligase n=1 Tax=Nonomuraea sp. NPDC050663 TaxID=3364370 RepID=UPI0037B96722
MRSTMQDVPLTVSRILRHGAAAHGGSRVVSWTGDGPRERSFAEIAARAGQLATALRDELGVDGDQRVATLMWNTAEHLEAYLAVPSMGAVLHTLNLRLPQRQLAYIIRHADDSVVIADASLVPLLPEVKRLIVVPDDYEELIAGRDPDFPWPELDEREAAAMCYTSGTTGDPKGVAYSHRSIYLHSMQVNMIDVLGSTPADTTLPVVPMFHVNAWGIPHAAFMGGVNLLMPGPHVQPPALAEMIETVRPTHAAGVPTVWQGLLQELRSRPRDVSSLQAVVVGGSACPPALMRSYDEELGVRIVHAWGMTEMSPLGSVAVAPPAAEDEWSYRVTQGRFQPGVEARLCGPDGTVLPWDGAAVGELEVRGPCVTASYYAADAPDKFSPDGWLRTGDVGTITPDGYLTLTDRVKDVIKSGGEWISSVELENHLMAHPGILEAAVVAVPDDKWGERPLAVVVPEGEADFHALRDFLGERVARWQLPERWTVVESVPKTSVGKFDKKLIRAQYAGGELDVTSL